MSKVLVTDCSNRKALAVVRSLGKSGYHVVASGNEKINMTRFSKYCSDFFYQKYNHSQPENYIKELLNYIKHNRIEVLFPMEDETVEIVIKNIDLFNKTVKTLLPGIDSFMIGRDKSLTLKSAEASGITIPNTYYIDMLDEVYIIKETIDYPVVIKPRITSGSRGMAYAYNKDQLISLYENIHGKFELPLIQQYINGAVTKKQVLLLMDTNHEVKGLCSYESIREYPVNGGPVSLWKTISAPDLEKESIIFLKKIKWVGFAELEYMVNDETGKCYLMEINPRFSSNIALAINVGVNFPLLVTKILFKEDFEPVFNNRLEEYCQWLLPGDFLNFIFNKKRFKQDFGYFFNKPDNLCYAILSGDDIKSVLGALLFFFLGLFNIKNIKGLFKRY